MQYNFDKYNSNRGTRWRSWLSHCATSRKLAGSIPDGVIGIFYCINISGRTKALESTRIVLVMSKKVISLGGKSGRCTVLATLPHSCAEYLEILGASNFWSSKGLNRPVM